MSYNADYGRLAQLVEQSLYTRKVTGSSPVPPTQLFSYPRQELFVVRNIFLVVTRKISRPCLAVRRARLTSLRLAQKQKICRRADLSVFCVFIQPRSNPF